MHRSRLAPRLASLAGILLSAAALALDEKTDPKQALLDGFKGLSRVKAYRIRSITSARTTATTVLEYVAPDRFRMVTERAETVVTPGATYIKHKGGRWSIAPVDVSELIGRFRDPKEIGEISDAARARDFKLLGSEVLDGVPTFVYQYTSVADGQTTVTKVWLGAVNGLPRKKETQSEFGSEKVTSVVLIEYDPNLAIGKPIG